MKTCLLTVVMTVSSSLAPAQAAIPAIATGGIVTAADYTSAIAPGSLIAVFGDGMASKTTSASGAPLPITLDGTSLEVNGQPIPLFFVSQRQINAQMPFGLSGAVPVRVRTAVGVSAAATLTVLPSAPRLFTKTMDGKGEPILIHGSDWSLVSAASPAVAGEYLILFLTGLITPVPSAPMVQTVSTGQGVPMFNGKVRRFFEAQGDDRKTRIFWIDSVDGFTGQDFNTGSSTTCSTAADFSQGGGCLFTVAIGVEGDAVQPNAKIPNARQQKLGYPTLSDWRWTGAPGTFMVFTTDRINNCTVANRNHGYAVWDGSNWKVQYDSVGCPKLFPYTQAAFRMHTGGVRYKLYYGDTAITTGRLSGQLPFLGPKKMIYADGSVTGAADRVDFEDWENQSSARDVVFLWPNGEALNDTAEGYIDDYHFLTPTGSMDLQVMYMAITNGAEFPFAAAAILLNP